MSELPQPGQVWISGNGRVRVVRSLPGDKVAYWVIGSELVLTDSESDWKSWCEHARLVFPLPTTPTIAVAVVADANPKEPTP